jgi:hypothetical protein
MRPQVSRLPLPWYAISSHLQAAGAPIVPAPAQESHPKLGSRVTGRKVALRAEIAISYF